jgi:hypothetical protein
MLSMLALLRDFSDIPAALLPPTTMGGVIPIPSGSLIPKGSADLLILG